MINKLVLIALMTMCTAGAMAGVVFEGVRVDYGAVVTELRIKLSISDNRMRIDVLHDNLPRASISIVDSTIVVADYVTGHRSERRIVAEDEGRSLGVEDPAASVQPADIHVTARQQFALGSFCRMVEVWSDQRIQQELCVAPANRIPVADASQSRVRLLTELLMALVASEDPAELLQSSLLNLPPSLEITIPSRVRVYGVRGRELSFVQVVDHALPDRTFTLPRRLKPMAHPEQVAQHDKSNRFVSVPTPDP